MSVIRKNSDSRSSTVTLNSDFSLALAQFLEHSPKRTHTLTRLFLETGITTRELVSLKKSDIKGTKLHIRSKTTKNGQGRKITLSTRLVAQLHTQLATSTSEYLFSTRQSPQLTTRRVEQLFKETAKKAGVSITPRDIRQAYLEASAKKARNNEELRALTGLRSIQKKRTLSNVEEQRLEKTLARQPLRERALIGLLRETGATLSTVLSLKTTQLKGTQLILPTQNYHLSTRLTSLLRQLTTHTTEYFFSTRQSTQLTQRRAEQLISELGISAKVEGLTPQVLRNTTIEHVAWARGAVAAYTLSGNKTPLTYTHAIVHRRKGGGRQ